ncbi:hypothetical protein C7974DRAFT_460029 [Boeremia exigua]|uniref:uncharacterized protein n=1 Tax=Boeremia exigua TaxID=749465 RepID=UPI001E8DC7FA|nr:uncharacterized protein C7974DRAFT_460029 [Boeremia exigua]KAH6644465.1 hypothetical protein C7974DRAFT_460029 [Boeremia exigua]
MSFNYDRYDRRQPATRARSTFGYWVPLVLTVTVATAGLAAWVWSERRDDEDESSEDDNLSYGEDERTPRGPHAPLDRDATGLSQGVAHPDALMARVQGVIRRTPSPQQVFDSVSKKTAAGWAAAGAALASIREEDKDDAYGDHSRWSEEAAIRRSLDAQAADQPRVASRSASNPAAKRKTVVVVVSAESLTDTPDDDAPYRSENATLLSHLPPTDFSQTRLFILIYSPTLRSHPPSRAPSPSRSPLGSSYSAIGRDDLTPVDPTVYTPAASVHSTPLHASLLAQAAALVEHPAMALPFATPGGHVHMLRHLAPDLVYTVDALAGEGRYVADVRRWVGQVVVVVGAGGLVDTDDEAAGHGEGARGRWWEKDDMVGLGKGVEVVDVSRFEDDFERRVGGKE